MKHLKKKLIAATSMMLLCAVMLTGVSYAWFTLSTNPEISKMTAKVSANENLEIALDNGYTVGEGMDVSTSVDYASRYDTTNNVAGSTTNNPYTWGNLLDLSYAFTTSIPNNGANEILIQPVKYNAETSGAFTKFQYPKYGNDGRVSGLGDLSATYYTAHNGTTVNATTSSGVAVYGATTLTDPDGNGTAAKKPYYAFSATYWLRSNESGNVTLQTAGVERADDEIKADVADQSATNASNLDVNTIKGAGSYIKIPGFATTTTTTGEAGKVTVTGSGATATYAVNSYSEVQQSVIDYLGNLKVRFVTNNGEATNTTYTTTTAVVPTTPTIKLNTDTNVYDAYFYITGPTDDADTTAVDESVLASLERNVAKKVTMYVYLDGETLTNADALLTDIASVEFNVQFKHSGITSATTDGDSAITGGNK